MKLKKRTSTKHDLGFLTFTFKERKGSALVRLIPVCIHAVPGSTFGQGMGYSYLYFFKYAHLFWYNSGIKLEQDTITSAQSPCITDMSFIST
jgi:hypothetical protein